MNENVLAEQKLSSPFRPGTIRYDFDSRSYYSQVDDLIFRHVATKFNIEAGKYFLGLQSIEQTLERLEKA